MLIENFGVNGWVVACDGKSQTHVTCVVVWKWRGRRGKWREQNFCFGKSSSVGLHVMPSSR
jgi:hypothetical protein